MRAHVLLTQELLSQRPLVSGLLRACVTGLEASGHTVTTGNLVGTCDRLVLWGIGTPETGELAARARADGAHVVSLDLAYWGRQGSRYTRPYRMSVDAPHPHKFLMSMSRSAVRWDELGLSLRSEHQEDGHVVLVGMGWKAARHYHEEVGHWERSTARLVSAAWPGRRLVFRPKPGDGRHCQGVPGIRTETGSVESMLRGAALVVCRHSNVGVDAILAGVPVSTEDGAAAAVYSGGYEPRAVISDELRLEFVHNLAWFQWTEAEYATSTPWAVVEQVVAGETKTCA